MKSFLVVWRTPWMCYGRRKVDFAAGWAGKRPLHTKLFTLLLGEKSLDHERSPFGVVCFTLRTLLKPKMIATSELAPLYNPRSDCVNHPGIEATQMFSSAIPSELGK